MISSRISDRAKPSLRDPMIHPNHAWKLHDMALVTRTAAAQALQPLAALTPFHGMAAGIGPDNNVLLSLLLNEFSDAATGVVDAVLQGSNDGQNWTEIGRITVEADEAGKLQVASCRVQTRFYRVAVATEPAGNTTSYHQDSAISRQ
jgi:hypothetical protein